MHEIIFTFLID